MNTRRRVLTTASLSLLLLAVPSTAWLKEQSATPAPGLNAPATEAQETAPASVQTGELAVPQAKPAEPGAAVTYTIKQGDTLWDISNTFLKDPFLWPLVWKANPSIANPDLIYPGNVLVIPGLAPIERAMQKPEAPKEEKKEEAPIVREAPPEMPFMGKPPMTEAPAEEEAPRGSRLILPEEVAPPLVDKYTMLSAGFVANDDGSKDRVVGGFEPKSVYSFDDVVFVKMHNPDEVNIGDKMLIYDTFKRVKHPATGRNFGKLIRVLGIMQVTAKEPSGVISGRITLSFDAVELDDLVTMYEEPTLIYPGKEGKAKDIVGYVLEVRDTRTINGQIDIVYLDKGTVDGVEPGDRFTVYLEPNKRGFPKKNIGEAQVFLVKDRTSTAVVTKSIDAVARGDRITYKQ